MPAASRRPARAWNAGVPFWRRPAGRAAILAVVVAATTAVVLPLGSFEVPWHRVWATLVNPGAATHDEHLIVWEFRLPRILLAVVAGAMLGVAGALMQSATRNGLADPGLVGVTEGATLAILFAVFVRTDIPADWYPALGMAGGIATAGAVILLTRRVAGAKFILIGIGVSAFLGAGIAVFITYGQVSRVQSAMVWMAGSLAPASWELVARALPWAVGGIAVALLTTRAADVAVLGDRTAISLGVRTARLRLVLVGTSVALTAASVAAIGTLGFVGLIAPHFARFLVGTRQALLVIGSGLGGAALVLIADSVGRLAFAPLQIPAGIIMALVGVPFFLLLLWRRRNAL